MDIAKNLELLGYNSIQGQIECLTGLRIGGGNEVIEIGGIDNAIIKHPITKIPYIPGSSLKGKMRSLIELKGGKIGPAGDVHKYSEQCGKECEICRIFGVGGAQGSPFGPGRLLVRDANIREEDRGEWKDGLKKTEVKWENVINRIKGTAEHPRQMERVPAGTIFDLRLDYRVFSVEWNDSKDNGETDRLLFNWVIEGLKLIQKDTLGGSGSRGYGRVRFHPVSILYHNGEKKTIDLDVWEMES